jgi:flagellar biosynthesis/type III secretory pathway protein FliH
MTRPRARILPHTELEAARVLPLGAASAARPRRLPRAVLEAEQQAKHVLAEAQRQAERIQSRAQQAADDLRLQLEARTRAEALALVAHQALVFAKREEQRDKSNLEQAIELATLLAERLLGEELSLKPERVAALAKQALREAAGARRASIVANVRDAAELRASLNAQLCELDELELKEDPSLAAGHLRLETELGTIEANLGAQLCHLALSLRRLLKGQAP